MPELDPHIIDALKAFGGAMALQLFSLFKANFKAKKTIKEMRQLIREQRGEIEYLREENIYLRGESNGRD